MILSLWRSTTSRCFYCGSRLEDRIFDAFRVSSACLVDRPQQRCPNDCVSGLGGAPVHRLARMRGEANGIACDTVSGFIRIR